MEHFSQKEDKEEDKKENKRKSKHQRISSTGRFINTPKHLETTSSDEQPPKKKSLTAKNLKAEIDRLKDVARVIENKKSQFKDTEKSNTTEESKQSEDKDESNNTDVFTLNKISDHPVDPFSLKDVHFVNVSEVKRNVKTKVVKSIPPSVKAASVLANLRGNSATEWNNDSSATAHLDMIVSDNSSKNRENIPPTPVVTKQMKSPHSKASNTDNQIDQVSDMMLPMTFQRFVQQKLTKIENQNETLIDQNDQIIKLLDKMGTGEEKLYKTFYEPLKGFPISNIEQFNELNSRANKELRQKVYDHLFLLRGTKLREFLNCGLKEIMTDELMCKFTWHKGKNTEQLGNTRVLNTLYQAAVNIKIFEGPKNKSVFKSEMLQVLRATKQRFRNARRKSLSKVIDETEEGEEAEENIQRRISELEHMMSGSDADGEDEEFESNNSEDEEFN